MATTTEEKSGFPFIRQYSSRSFVIDIARTEDQLDAVFALRYQIFNEELKQGLTTSVATQRDQDKYDKFCDHLLVIEAETQMIVGTYRLHRCDRSKDSHGYYSASEFDLKNIIASQAKILEIGRACIHANYRDGSVMQLLWYGLARYLQLYQFKYLCGCASLEKDANAETASLIYAYAKQYGKITPPDLRVTPNPDNAVVGFDPTIKLTNSAEVKQKIPALLRGYFAINCKIAGEPAFDPEFSVIDFFVMFDTDELINGPAKRFII